MGLFSGIKKYVVGLIIKTSSDPANLEVRLLSCTMLLVGCVVLLDTDVAVCVSLQKEGVYISKLNMILVQVN